MGISHLSTSLAPFGITDETDTRFCSPMPAEMSALSNALRSETGLTAELWVMKNLDGTSSMPAQSRSLIIRVAVGHPYIWAARSSSRLSTASCSDSIFLRISSASASSGFALSLSPGIIEDMAGM